MNCRNNLIPLCSPRTKLLFSTGTTSTAPRQQGITMTAILQAVNRDKTNYQCLQSTSSKYDLESLITCCLPFLCFHRLNLREVTRNSQSDSKMKGKMLRLKRSKVFLYCSGKCTFFPGIFFKESSRWAPFNHLKIASFEKWQFFTLDDTLSLFTGTPLM